jgi:hypothetical protein
MDGMTLTEIGALVGFITALQKLAREGQIVDTGRRRWSKRCE